MTLALNWLWRTTIALALLTNACWCQKQQIAVNGSRDTVPARGQAEIRPATTTSQYNIGSGDVLTIQVWKEKDLSQTVVVRPDGKISIPLLGEIEVAGKEPLQLQKVIQEKLSAMVVDPRVTVTVAEIHSRMVYITGEVARPGAYPLNSSITVLQLIAQAGGLTEYASRKNIHVIRGSNAASEYWLSYKALTRGTDPNRNLALTPGDTVVIP